MTVKFLEPGGDADFGIGLWPGVVGTPAAATDFVHGTHLRSIKYRPNNVDEVYYDGILSDTGTRFSCYAYFVALTNATHSLINFSNSGSSTNIIRIRMTSAGTLQLWGNSAQFGSDGATLVAGRWYKISLAYVITSTTINDVKLFVDGVLSISLHNVTLDANATSQLDIGNISPDAQLDWRSSDHYVDDSAALTDTGNIWVTAKRPNANGTTNGFTTQIGSGGSGYGSGHSPQVNERALSQTNGWSMVGAGSAVTEEYTIESAATGDIDISAATIIDYMGWVSAKSVLSETASIVVGGSSSNISLTSTAAMFSKVKGSATYPAGGTDIGIITSTTVTTVSLYEAGIVVAYIPNSVNAAPFLMLTGYGM